MIDQQHPITPPPELVGQWLKQFYGPATRLGTLVPGEASLHVAAAAAIRALADQVVPKGGNFIAVRIRADILAIATELENAQ